MEFNITLVKGDTLAFGFQVENITELTAAYFSVKANKEDSGYILQKSLYHGIEHVEDDIYRLRAAPEDTKEISAGRYYYDLEIQANGDTFTVLTGELHVIYGITD